MSIWEILWIVFVAFCFVGLIVSACTADPRRENYDTPLCRNIGITMTGFILLIYYVKVMSEPYVPIPKSF
jgi:hypothetical protein